MVAIVVLPAYADIVPPQRSLLFSYAMNLVKDRASADDLVQEALVRALEAWPRFSIPPQGDVEQVVRGWLYTIVHNLFVNGWRRKQRWREDELEVGETDVAATLPEARIGEDSGYSDEVVAAMASLDPDQRQVVHLISVEGLSYKGAAEALGVPVGTVMSRLCRARRKLEEALAQYAAKEYGLGRQGASEDPDRLESGQTPQPEPDGIDAIVVGLDASQLLGG